MRGGEGFNEKRARGLIQFREGGKGAGHGGVEKGCMASRSREKKWFE